MADLTPGTSARKQPGRRYGPPPSSSPHPEMQAPKPMRTSVRVAAYRRQNGRLLGLSARQNKQINRMSLRAAHLNNREEPSHV